MKLGIFTPAPNAARDAAVVAKRAEELGFESYWVADHTVIPVHSSQKYPGADPDGREPDYLHQIPDPLITLAIAAAATERIGLATGVCLVPERNAILLAKQVATLDHASGGRVLFGIGGGWNPEESTILGGDFEHRWTQIKESIRAIRALWCEDPSEHHGKYVDFPPVRCFPKPARKPHPPVLLGSINNPRALRRVVEWGDGWVPIVASVEEFADGVATIRRLAKEKGRDPATIDLTAFGMPGQWQTEDELAALERAGANRATIWIHELERSAALREIEQVAKTHAKRLAG
jgi:probable F420-dependent oxidoreductase